MSYRIVCHTLFDITATGVINRTNKPVDANIADWTIKRNTQCNFDTVLQIISLRSQPELLSQPTKLTITPQIKQCFGTQHKFNKHSQYWTFEFYIQHASVFNNGVHELGGLYSDTAGVPMILVGTEVATLINSLDTTPELKNIHYEILSNESTT